MQFGLVKEGEDALAWLFQPKMDLFSLLSPKSHCNIAKSRIRCPEDLQLQARGAMGLKYLCQFCKCLEMAFLIVFDNLTLLTKEEQRVTTVLNLELLLHSLKQLEMCLEAAAAAVFVVF